MTVPPIGKAFLDTLASAESKGDYSLQYGDKAGHGTISDFSHHPGMHNGHSVAGKYQFQQGTWKAMAKKLGLTDFSPASQDEAAWALAKQLYHTSTKRDLEVDLTNRGADVLPAVVKALRSTWPSLPGGSQQNPSNGWDHFTALYKQNVATAGATPDTALSAISGLLAGGNAGVGAGEQPIAYEPQSEATPVTPQIISHGASKEAVAAVTNNSSTLPKIKVTDINPDGSEVKTPVMTADGSAQAGQLRGHTYKDVFGPVSTQRVGSSTGEPIKISGSPGQSLLDILGGLTEAATGGTVEVPAARKALAQGVEADKGQGKINPGDYADFNSSSAQADKAAAQDRFGTHSGARGALDNMNNVLTSLFGAASGSAPAVGSASVFPDTGNGNATGIQKVKPTVNVRPDGTTRVTTPAGGGDAMPKVILKTPAQSNADARPELESLAAKAESAAKRAIVPPSQDLTTRKVKLVPIKVSTGQPEVANSSGSPDDRGTLPNVALPQLGLDPIKPLTAPGSLSAGGAVGTTQAIDPVVAIGSAALATHPAVMPIDSTIPLNSPKYKGGGSGGSGDTPSYMPPVSVKIASGKTVPVGTRGTAQGGKYQYRVLADGSVWNETTHRNSADSPYQGEKWWQSNNP